MRERPGTPREATPLRIIDFNIKAGQGSGPIMSTRRPGAGLQHEIRHVLDPLQEMIAK